MADPQASAARYESKSERITRAPQIIALLRRIRDSHSLLNVTVPGSNQSFSSLLLDIDTDRRFITLDELNSQRGHALVVENGRLRARCHHEGVEISFACEDVKAVRGSDGLVCYRAPLPTAVNYLQRRADYRVRVAMDMKMQLFLDPPDGRTIEGRVDDISMGGIGALVEGRIELRRGLQIPECRIQLPEQKPILVDLEVRFTRSNEKGTQTRIGTRFVNLEPQARGELRKLVTRLEREMLRRKAKARG